MDICSEIMRQVLNHKFTKVGTPIFWSPNVSCYVQLLFFLFQKCTVTNSFPKIVFKEIYQNWNSNILKQVFRGTSIVFLVSEMYGYEVFPQTFEFQMFHATVIARHYCFKENNRSESLQGDLPTSEFFFLYPRVLCHSYRSKNVRLITSNSSWVWILLFWIHCRAPGMMFKEENHSP